MVIKILVNWRKFNPAVCASIYYFKYICNKYSLINNILVSCFCVILSVVRKFVELEMISNWNNNNSHTVRPDYTKSGDFHF